MTNTRITNFPFLEKLQNEYEEDLDNDFIYEFANHWVNEWLFGKITYEECKMIIKELGDKLDGTI